MASENGEATNKNGEPAALVSQLRSATSVYLAVDLGASSGRVIVGGFDAQGQLSLREAHRFVYPPHVAGGHQRWDFAHILKEVKRGLSEGAKMALAAGQSVRSVGVDTWGVDYGLLDGDERLLEDPITYRDNRTQGAMDAVFSLAPRTEIFERTGIQFLVFNTLFQLRAHSEAGLPAAAERLMLIPDLIHHALCGRIAIEFTNATTTQLVNAHTGDWDLDLLGRIGVDPVLLPEIVPAGTDLGPVTPNVGDSLGLQGARVVAPATHDTGSAVVGAPLKDGWGYISSGTWSLVGTERNAPLINEAVARENFTNEGGAFGTVRFLKNVMGLWLLESCRREWAEAGEDVAYDALLARAHSQEAQAGVASALIFPDDARFLSPDSMVDAIAQQLRETNQVVPGSPAGFTRVIMDSLALRYARIVDTIERLSGDSLQGLQIVGGGCQNAYLNQATANASGKTVEAGPVEATATGNVLVQAIAAGVFTSLDEARMHLASQSRFPRYTPTAPDVWSKLRQRYATIEQRYAP